MDLLGLGIDPQSLAFSLLLFSFLLSLRKLLDLLDNTLSLGHTWARILADSPRLPRRLLHLLHLLGVIQHFPADFQHLFIVLLLLDLLLSSLVALLLG